jgi:hypothetical protein
VIVRIVLAAVTTTALLAASSPALSAARADRADATVERQLSTLSERLSSLAAHNDATPAGAARQVVTLRLPERTVTTAAVDRLTVQTANGSCIATWTVGDRRRGREPLVDVPVRPTDGALVLREPGTHRLAFTLTTSGGDPAVVVDRLGPPEGAEL